MRKEARIFEDLHTLAHRWTQYCSEDNHATFKEFLEKNEPGRHQRLYKIFCVASEQEECHGENG